MFAACFVNVHIAIRKWFANKKQPFSKHYFRIKGTNAESIVHNLATRTFLIDWCFLNPKLPDGKELYDLLVVFDDVAIIWQIKDLKLDKKGKYKKSEVDKNLRQLAGARRQIFDLKTPICMKNIRREEEIFNFSNIKQVFLISVLLGQGEEYFSFIDEIKANKVHVFTRVFTQIVLNELDQEPRDKRKAMLSAICWIGMAKFKQNKKVIGIATEMKIRPICSYDFLFMHSPEWTVEHQKYVERLQKDTGIFVNPIIGQAQEDEYPRAS